MFCGLPGPIACVSTWHACRTETAEYIKVHSNKALELNNRLSNLKKELQLLEQQAAVLEAQQDYSLQVAAQKTLEYGQASLPACRNPMLSRPISLGASPALSLPALPADMHVYQQPVPALPP